MGDLTSIVYPDNTAVNYAYDANNNLVSVTDWANRVTSYTYDVNNMLVGVTKPDGSVTATVYDNTGRINGYSQKDDDLIAYAEYLIDQGYFEAFEYSYKYLLKYDKEFIAPYISDKRETADYFANNTVNGYLNKEYVKSFIEAL